MLTHVELSRRADKQLAKAPQHIAAKLLAWMDAVEEKGLEQVRKVPGFNDHPLKGTLAGKRAIRLSRQWRAVYEVKGTKENKRVIEFVEIQEIHPHGY